MIITCENPEFLRHHTDPRFTVLDNDGSPISAFTMPLAEWCRHLRAGEDPSEFLPKRACQ